MNPPLGRSALWRQLRQQSLLVPAVRRPIIRGGGLWLSDPKRPSLQKNETHPMEDSFAVHACLETHAPRSAVIVGGGYIGMEMADAFVHRGLSVTVVEHGASVLKTVDASLGRFVSAELRQHGVQVVTHVAVERIAQ